MMRKVKWSLFIVDTLDVDNSSNVILFNTSTMSLLSVDRDFYIELKRLDPGQIEEFCSKSGCSYVFENLVEEEFLLPETVDEEKEYVKSVRRQIQEHDTLAVHFLPTLGCNFRCPYCYQDGISRTAKMTCADVDKITSKIEEYIKDNPMVRYLTITLHGGKPTCNWDIVPYAMEQFNTIADRNGVVLRTGIVSNGYLLSPEKANLLSKYNWHRFQVTIDGPPEVHNTRRRLPNGQDTFTPIINNIKYILNQNLLPAVDVRINFDKSNFESISSLIDYMAREFDPQRILLSFGYISQTVEGNACHDYIQDEQIQYEDFYEKYLQLFLHAYAKGFPFDDAFLFGGLCMSKLRNSFAFSPDGAIYKCLSMVGREDGKVSSWRTQCDLEAIPSLMDYDLLHECFEEKCPLIPMCNADCRFDSLVCNGDLKIRNCRRDILMKINRAILYTKYAQLSLTEST